uniref:Uncharacterized protein n=1 Tax=Knipowitschia caucasica TaxID=637954 RepID=A0AAV2MH83_KNICA
MAGIRPRLFQFQVLTGRSCGLVPVLPGLLGPEEVGFSLVLMDHRPGLFLSDLQALEGAGLLRPGGCSVLFTCRDRATVTEIQEYAQSRGLYGIHRHSCFIELSYRSRGGAVNVGVPNLRATGAEGGS